jgi:ribonucleoside-diphosphate reductase subunit M2
MEGEPILTVNPARFVLFPIQYQDIWDLYKAAQASNWTAEEVDLSQDVKEWVTLSVSEQHFLSHVLAFFASSDAIVNENLATRFMKEVQIPEARAFYGAQIAIENVHSEMYALMIETYIKDPTEKKKLFNAIQTIPCVAKKADWAMKWIDSNASFAIRLIAFAVVEGLFFSGSFCAIFWMKKRNLLPGLSLSNEFISRDEGMHYEHAGLVYSYLKNKPTKLEILELVKEAVAIEIEFITVSLSVSLLGMNAEMMITYIKYIADRILVDFGVGKYYLVQNPFVWMELIALNGKSNFFERRPSEYAKANMKKSKDASAPAPHVFSTNEDF